MIIPETQNILLHKLNRIQNHVNKQLLLVNQNSETVHRTGTLIQPFAKAMAKITKGVDIPNMMIYGRGVFMGFSPSLSPAVCQYLHLSKFYVMLMIMQSIFVWTQTLFLALQTCDVRSVLICITLNQQFICWYLIEYLDHLQYILSLSSTTV